MRLLSLVFPSFLLLQVDLGSKTVWDFGVAVGMLLVVVALWREDRKGREKAQESSEERYSSLVGTLTDLLRSNTRALTELRSALDSKIIDCPYREHLK